MKRIVCVTLLKPLKQKAIVYHCFLQEDYVEGENDGKIQEACLQKFSSRDYIMEPAIFNTLKT